ncbi:MAG: putative sugar nucleotidyl transferase [candidate division WOR-3 bacterium]
MIFVYEDQGFENLLPLVLTRPVFELRCGNFTILERIQRFYPNEEVVLLVRDHLVAITKEKNPQYKVQDLKSKIPDSDKPLLFLSARSLLEAEIPVAGDEELFITPKTQTTQPEVIGFRIKPKGLKFPIAPKTIAKSKLKPREIKAKSIKFLWDLIALNVEFLKKDFPGGQVKGTLEPRAIIYGDLSRLYLEAESKVEPGVILNLHAGPIYLDRGATIRPLSLVEGPCYIGKNTIIDSAKIRPNCSFGENCRIGGEVEASIFQGFSNKHHDGFLGHSYIGEWVNIGAGTSNSDLRNDYGSVKVTLGKQVIDSGSVKLGCFIGDHTKIAIGTLINTGTVIGIFANVFFPGLTPKTVPSFSWGGKKRWKIDEVLKTAKAMMARRNVLLTKNYEKLIRYLYRRLTT